MEEKKHIDRLFQEKLKDFEMNPDSSIWTNIENRLVKKKKRRVLPLWLRIGSVAATLLLLISSGIWIANNSDKERAIEDQNKVPAIITDSKKEDVLNTNQINNSTNKTLENTIESEKTKKQQEEVNGQISFTNQQKNSNRTKKLAEDSTSINSKKETEQRTINTIAKTDNSKVSMDKQTLQFKESQQQEVDALATNETPTNLEDNKENIVQFVEAEKEIVALKEDEIIERRWSVGSAVAPVYFSSLRSGSPIDVSLATNEKSSDISMSYGLKINYKINSKLSLQSGISSVELGYQTKNVSALITSSKALTNSTNIDTNVKGFEVVTMSNDNIAIQSQELTAPQQRGFTSLSGDLNQFMNYLEIPAELKYTMIQKKVGLHVIGGVSTYILYKNGVTLSNLDGTTALGEASNLNELNFSGNIGLDFDYKLNKKLYINVSPMFKYQFNTFSKSAGGFQPYYLGIYTGLNFRF